MGKLGGR